MTLQALIQWCSENKEGVFLFGIAAISIIYTYLSSSIRPPASENEPQAANLKNVSTGDITAGGAVIHGDHNTVNNYILSQGDFDNGLLAKAQDLQSELSHVKTQGVQDQARILFLENHLAKVKNDLTNRDLAYQNEINRRRRMLETLESMQRKQPEERIKIALTNFKAGRLAEAESILQAVYNEAKSLLGEAAYLLGGVSETRFDIKNAQRFYNEAVEQDPNNIEYLQAASEAYKGFDAEQVLTYLRRELEELTKIWGEDSEVTLDAIFALARAYMISGSSVQAIPLLEKHLAFSRTQPVNLLKTSSVLSYLGGAYHHQNLYKLAEPLYEEALSIDREALGDKHPNVANSLNSLAMLYQAQGHYEQAEPLLKEALSIRREALGDKHPEVASSLNNLASLYQAQGHFEQAEPLHEEALSIDREALGDKHPEVASSLNNLAMLYQDQGHYEQAEPLYEEALSIRREALGDKHPDVVTSLDNLTAIQTIKQTLTLSNLVLTEKEEESI